VVSVTQLDFIKGRTHLDGVLIANEVVDEIKKKKRELVMFKVDFEKHYNYALS